MRETIPRQRSGVFGKLMDDTEFRLVKILVFLLLVLSRFFFTGFDIFFSWHIIPLLLITWFLRGASFVDFFLRLLLISALYEHIILPSLPIYWSTVQCQLADTPVLRHFFSC